MTHCRNARISDLDALLELEQQSFEGDRLSARQLRRHVTSPSACLRVIDGEDGRIVASALWFFRKGSRQARLYSIAVAAHARGRGLARTLMTDGESIARTRGCTRIGLEVRIDNVAAQNLYRRLGYLEAAHKTGYYEDGADALCMRKRLTGPNDAA